MRPPTLACLLAYRGDLFHGFQRQGELPTIERSLRHAIAAATGHDPIALAVAGRTDAGVHARAQVISFRLPDPPPPVELRTLINGQLPPGIFIRGMAPTSRSFHARSSALAKRYRYRIEIADGDPLAQHRAWRLATPLDVEAMVQAATGLVGRRDCSAFRARGCSARSPICRIDLVRVRARGRLITIDIEADRFLRRMARAMVGHLVEVGTGVREATARPMVAPARGLYLLRVYYAAALLGAAAATGGATVAAMVNRPLATVSTLSAIWS